MTLLETATRLQAAFDAGDIDTVLDAMAPEVELINPLGNRFHGRAEAERWLSTARQLDYRIEPAGPPEVSGQTVTAPITLAFPDGGAMAAAIVARFEDGAIACFELRRRAASAATDH